jgi:pimeloyl-ACP methyl ester carboxylesterase
VTAEPTRLVRRIALCAAIGLSLAASCGAEPQRGTTVLAPAPDVNAGAHPSSAVKIRRMSVLDDLPVLRVEGARGPERVVFLHGMCSNPDEYLRSFRFAAARVGRTIALLGDTKCPDRRADGRTWSHDIRKLDRRIEKAWRAAGDNRPLGDVIVVGHSLGAVRAEALARFNPERYRQLILIGGPKRPAAERLRQLEAVVLVAGERDRQAPMKAGQRELEAVGVPATFLALPEASHSEMGPEAERVMSRAFDFLLSTEKVDVGG